MKSVSALFEVVQERFDPPALILFAVVGALALVLDHRLVLGFGLKREARFVKTLGWTYVAGAFFMWIVLHILSPSRM